MRFRCPNCDAGITLADFSVTASDATANDIVVCPTCNSKFDFTSDQTKTAWPGTGRKLGQYEIRERLGEGAFGAVYLAYDTELERRVAIKMPREGRMRPDSLPAFFREARAASTIQHPGVIRVYEVGSSDQVPYLVTELIDGVSLASWLQTNKVTARHAAELMKTICEAVQAAHDHKVIHRDLKPGNVLLDQQLRPHVGDFGLARREGTNDLTVTINGKVFGTPAYMSPEQARGQTDQVQESSDIYSLGVCLYELLTGKRPFRATDSQTVLFQIITKEPRPPRKVRKEIPRDLETICLKAIEKQPERRYRSAAEMAADLGRFLDGRPIEARPVARLERGWRWVRRNRALSAAVLLACLLLVTVAAAALLPPPRPVAETIRTHLACRLPKDVQPAAVKVDWAFAPLDDKRQPDADRVTRRWGEGAKIVADLEPGEYLVVASVAGIGFSEVYRQVPKNPANQSFQFSATQFTVIDDGIELAPIPILREQQVIRQLQLIRGGTYEAGTDDPPNPFSPRTEFQVADFYLQPTEVTYADFISWMSEPNVYKQADPPPTGKHPIVGIHWYQAAHYAEAIGCRLISEIEWEYAATNGGTTPLPWIGDKSPEPRWQLREVDKPTVDITPLTKIRGLMSNAAEITSSKLAPFGSGVMPAPSARQTVDSFIYKGGPATRTALASGFDPTPQMRTCLESRLLSGDFLSFRCGRSARPRFLDADARD